jgi:hypothetical protein
MARSRSPREIEHDLKKLRDREDAPADAADLTVRVEWRDAAPEDRPDGMAWDPPADDGSAVLRYDLWAAQRDALEAVDSGEFDIVAAVMGYGAGKSILGARWTIRNALDHAGSRFLVMGQDFAKAKPTTFKTLFAQLPGERTDVVTAGYSGPAVMRSASSPHSAQ